MTNGHTTAYAPLDLIYRQRALRAAATRRKNSAGRGKK